MDIRKLQRAIVDGLEEVKGQNIVVFNTEHLSPLFERVIIASGTSNRQTRALAASVRDAVKSSGFGLSRTEGEDNGEWIIVDCGAAVVHLMQPSIREYYYLEEIWGDKPVRLKLDSAPARLVKATEPEPKVARVARKSKSSAAPKAGAPKTGTAKTVTAKAVTAKAVTAKTVTAKTVPAKSTSAKTAAAPKRAASATPRKRAASTGAQPATSAPASAKRPAAPRKTVTRSVGVKRASSSATSNAGTSAPRKAPAAKRAAAATKTTRRKA
jgi:ribosome-associated protein